MSASRTPKAKTQAIARLTPEELTALNDLKNYYKKQTDLCKALTNNTVLTEAEYKRATPEFQRLIEIPRKKGEPIYIMPELDKSKKLHSRLAELVTAIRNQQPYADFINAPMGETWPLLLRLYLGLSGGFQISIEELHSMMKICYWRELKLTVTSVPFLEWDDLFGKVILSEAAEELVKSLHFPDGMQRGITSFIEAMRKPGIPNAERHIQLIELDVNHFRVARFILESTASKSNVEQVQVNLMIMAMKDSMLFDKKHGPYNAVNASQFLETGNSKMFGAIIDIGLAFYKISFLDGKPFLILPSQTILNNYFAIVNPDRKLKTVRLLGAYGPDIFEKCCDNNERPVNLYAPGITNPLIAHRKIVPPAYGLEHDDYHVLFEGTLTLKLYQQFTHGKNVLRKILGNDTECTSEILRLCDREQNPEANENDRFLVLLAYTFAAKLQGDIDEKSLGQSAIILLADMILFKDKWPSFIKLRVQVIKLLLIASPEEPLEFYAKFECAAVGYGSQTKNNIALVAILLLCQFRLKDTELCKILIKHNKEHPDTPVYAWRKFPHGHLYPVLILNGVDYEFDKLAQLKPGVRATLWLGAKFPVSTVTPEEKVEDKLVAYINVKIPNFNDGKRKLIIDNGGNIIEEPDLDKIAIISIDTNLLKKSLRDLLGLERLILQGEARAKHLAEQGMTIEFLKDTDGKFQVTFMQHQRSLVEKAAKQWHLIENEKSTELPKLRQM